MITNPKETIIFLFLKFHTVLCDILLYFIYPFRGKLSLFNVTSWKRDQ